METFLIILAGLLLIVGLLGCILPVLPGTPLSYLGLLVLHFTDKVQFSTLFLVLCALAVVVVQLLDYYIPIWGTKRFGGSRWGTIGSAIGLFAGFFLGPWGIILGPFAGAFLGEWLSGRDSTQALKAGLGSFVGFLAGTVIKLVVAGLFIYYYVEALIA